MPLPSEVATLIVNGIRFEDWESVLVRRNWGDAFAYFQFTAAERDPIFNNPNVFPDWTKLQFKPGDHCTIYLAGELAITGFIEVRQVAYNANSHGVQLAGKSYSAQAAKSSVDTPDGNFDNKDLVTIANMASNPYGVAVRTIGAVDMTPFQQCQCGKGENVWDFVERLARVRGCLLAADAFGNFVIIGDHSYPIVAGLVEGKNIREMQCIISNEMVFAVQDVHGQGQASDDLNGSAASEMKATATSDVAPLYSKLITPMEESVRTIAELQHRANFEKMWHDGSQIQANITVQGWLREGQTLWHEGEQVHVYSPMAMLNEELAIQQVVFTQDNQRGTLTTLTCVLPEALLGQKNFNVAPPSPSQTPTSATVPTNTPPTSIPV
jgi:prophage tail gpP-like protein